MPRATITVAKTDAFNGNPVGRSVYIVKAAETIRRLDGVRAGRRGSWQRSTGEDGKATRRLYLGCTVYGGQGKDGHALDIYEGTSLEYAGQDVGVV